MILSPARKPTSREFEYADMVALVLIGGGNAARLVTQR
jgi:hypothetical protein